MVDIELLAQVLRRNGHKVEHVHAVPENAGAYELTVDGNVLNLEQARALLGPDEVDEQPSSDNLDEEQGKTDGE